MRKATRTRIKLTAVVIVAAVSAAACQGMKGSPSNPDKPKHHAAKCVKVTGKAHVEGTDRWYLVLKGRHQSALVTHKEFRKYGIGECFPTEET